MTWQRLQSRKRASSVPSPPRVGKPPGIESGAIRVPRDLREDPVTAAAGPAEASAAAPGEAASGAASTAQPPTKKPDKPEKHHIGSELGSPMRDDRGDAGSANHATERLMERMGDVILTMNNQISMLTKRIEELDRERAKKEDPDKLAKINHKDISKPGKYSGGSGWTTWAKNFTSFLERRDQRWPKLLGAIAKRSAGIPLNEDLKVAIAREAGILDKGNLEAEFEKQLYDYLQEFTSGDVLAAVIAGGNQGAWETWRYLCEHGKSRQPHSLKEEHRRLVHPKQSDIEGLMKAIHSWEADLAEHLQNGGRALDDEEKIMCLEEMCPTPLQEYLAEKAEEEIIKTYGQYKNSISAYVTRKLKSVKATRPGARALAPESEESPGEEAGDETQHWHDLQRLCALYGIGDLNALVNNKFGGKKGKGKGKFGANAKPNDGKTNQGATPMDVDHSSKDCYECGEVGHIGANCPQRKARLAAQGEQSGGKFGPGKGGKAGGKGGKYGGGKGYGGKNWPTLPMWNQMYPGPSQQQWKSWWQQAQSTGKVNLLEGVQQPATMQLADWSAATWSAPAAQPAAPSQPQSALKALFNQGTVYSLRHTNFEHANKFEILGDEAKDSDARPSATVIGPRETIEPDKYPIVTVTGRPLRNSRWGTSSRKTLCRGHGPSAGPACESACCQKSSAMKVDLMSAIKPPSLNKTMRQRRLSDEENQAEDKNKSLINDMLKAVSESAPVKNGFLGKQHFKLFSERSREALCQVQPAQSQLGGKAGKWEVLSAIVDSGASITAVSPKTGKAYKIQEGEACRRGVEYATAGQDSLPNLGEKHMAVLTKEGTVRGFSSQVADVSEPLESVRQLCGTRHCVLFGLGPNDDEHLIINKVTGEVNVMRDDGINYRHDMIIIPPDEIEQVQKATTQGTMPFGGQA